MQVTTNDYSTVFVYNFSGTTLTNTESQTVTSALPPYPDMVVQDLSLSPTTGLKAGDKSHG